MAIVRSTADWLLRCGGGRSRFAPVALARSKARADATGVVVVCHFPNLGHSARVDPAWERFTVTVQGRASVECARATRGVPAFLPATAGLVQVECDAVSPRLHLTVELSPSHVALVEVVPGEGSPRSGEMWATIIGPDGHRLRRYRGLYGGPEGVTPAEPPEQTDGTQGWA